MAKSTPPSQNDTQVEQVQKLFLRHTDRLRGYLFAVCPDLSLAEDLLHSVFLCVVEKADQYDPQRSFLAWARGIARNEMRRLARDRSHAPHMLTLEVAERLAVPDDLFQPEPERLAALTECVEELGPRAREAVVLRYLKQLLPGQIAGRMDLAVESVHVMLSRARAALRTCIEGKIGESAPAQEERN